MAKSTIPGIGGLASRRVSMTPPPGVKVIRTCAVLGTGLVAVAVTRQEPRTLAGPPLCDANWALTTEKKQSQFKAAMLKSPTL